MPKRELYRLGDNGFQGLITSSPKGDPLPGVRSGYSPSGFGATYPGFRVLQNLRPDSTGGLKITGFFTNTAAGVSTQFRQFGNGQYASGWGVYQNRIVLSASSGSPYTVFLNDGVTTESNNGGADYSASSLLTDAGLGGFLPAGHYIAYLIELDPITNGGGNIFVTKDSYFASRVSNPAGSGYGIGVADNHKLTVDWSFYGSRTVFVLLNRQISVGGDYNDDGPYYVYGPITGTSYTITSLSQLATSHRSYPEWNPKAGATNIVFRQARTWIGGNLVFVDPTGAQGNPPDPLRTVRYSDPGVVWGFHPSNFLECNELAGSITCMSNWADNLIVFSQRDAVIITGNSSQDFYKKRLPNVTDGAVSVDCVVEWNNSIYWLGRYGVYRLDTPNGDAIEVSAPIRDVFVSGLVSTPSNHQMVLDYKRRAIVVRTPYSNTVLYVFSFETNSWYTIENASAGVFRFMAGGDSFGVTFQGSATVRLFDDASGSIFTGTSRTFTTDYMDLSNPDIDKHVLNARVTIECTNAGTFVLTALDANGATVYTSPTRTVSPGRSTYRVPIPGHQNIVRGMAIKLDVVGSPDMRIVGPFEIEYIARKRRNK